MNVAPDLDTPPHQTGWFHAPWWRWVLRAVSAALLVAGLWFIVIPQWREAAGILPRLERLPVPLIVLAVLAEAASLLSFTGMTMILVRSGLSYPTALRIDLADLAVNHTVPGGGGVAAAARFRMFVARGIEPARAFAAASVETAASNMALGAVFAAGVILALGASPVSAADVWAGSAVAILLVTVGLTIWLLARRSSPLASQLKRMEGRFPILRRAHLPAVLVAAREQLATLRERPGRLALCAAFALGNWLLDAVALWFILAALGTPIVAGPLLAAYGAGTILAQLPITPGGLGVVEGVLVPSLVAFGVPADTALLSVLGWRALEYWLPIPIGGLAALSLYAGRRSTDAP